MSEADAKLQKVIELLEKVQEGIGECRAILRGEKRE
jgi:hypothetical protein